MSKSPDHASSHPYVYAILSGCISSVSAVLCRGALYEVAPLVVATIQFAVIAVVLLLFCERKTLRRLAFSDLRGKIFFLGLLQAASSFLYVTGSSYTTATNALFLTKVLPYWVLFWDWFILRRLVSRGELLLLFVHVIGAWCLSTGGAFATFGSAQAGDLVLVAAMMVAALATVVSQGLIQKLPAREILASTMTIAFAALIVPLLFTSKLHSLASASPRALWFLGTNCLFFVAIHLSALLALKTGKPWKVSALRALGPLLGLPFAVYLLGEKVTIATLVGGVVVLLTSAIMVFERKRAAIPDLPAAEEKA